MERFLNAGILLFVIVVIAAILFYLIKAKKRGENCIGCPYAKQCGKPCTKRKK